MSTSTNTGPDYELESFSPAPTRSQLPTSAAGDVSGRTNFRTSVINLDRPGNAEVFDERVRADAAELISRYPAGQGRSALLPLLHLVQSEQGYITPDGIAFCAAVLDITKAQVAAVATFYTMYKRHPTGEYLVSVCTNTLCGMLGGDEIFAALKDHLGVGNNETTPDGRITLEHAECLAACDYAPVLTVNYEFYDNQTIDSAHTVVSRLQSGERPEPTRGAPLCTFKQIERQIAGLYDEAALAPEANSSGGPTEAGVRLAIQRGDTAPSYAVDTTAPDENAPEPAVPAEAAAAESSVPDEPAHDQEPESQPGHKRSRFRSRGRGSSNQPDGAAEPSTSYGPSDDDAPLQTSASDDAHPAKPAGEEAQ